MSSPWDQITTKDHEGEIETRFLRPLLDGIAWSHNLSISLVKAVDEGDGRNQISWLARSFQSPFVEICRASEEFRRREDSSIASAIAETDFSMEQCAVFDAATPLYGLFSTAVVPTEINGIFIVLGPVLVRCENGTERFSEINRRKEAIAGLETLYREFSDQNKSSPSHEAFSKSRADRLIFQRAPILESDLKNRSRSVCRVFSAITSSDLRLAEVSAGSVEAFSKLVSFATSKHDEANSTETTVFPLHNTGVAIRCFGAASAIITISSSTSMSDLKIRLETDLNDKQSSLAAPDLNVDWSKHCDDYRTLRNTYYLERLLVTRLWLQDRFAGTTISSADGVERQEDFSNFARKVADFFSADGCIVYRFHPGETPNGISAARLGYLHPLGSFYAYDYFEDSERVESEHMAMIAEDPNRRQRSANYRCVDSGESVFLEDASDAEISTINIKPRSVLVVPLISRGRIWGTIEVIGKHRFQLPKYAERWLSELARTVTPIFYNQWVLFHFREMSRIAVSQEKSDVKYHSVLDHVRQLFLASSARLYIQHESRTSLFEKAAHAGVVYPPNIAENFELTSDKSISAKCIADEVPWKSGTIGLGDFEEEGYPEMSGPLAKEGHRAAMVFPVRSQGGLCFASVLVSSLDDDKFPEEWLTLVGTLSLQLSVILEAIHLQDLEVAEQRAYIAHTVKTRTDRVLNGGELVLGMLNPLFGAKDMYKLLPDFIQRVELALSRERNNANRREDREVLTALKQTFPAHESKGPSAISDNLPKAISDISEHLKELRISAVTIAGGNNAEEPFETRPELWGGTPCRLRLVLAESLKPLSGNSLYRNRLQLPPREVLDSSVAIEVPESVLIEILNNLFDNAIKYDFSPPSISYFVRPSMDEKTYSLVIRNLAPRLSTEHAKEIEFGGDRAWYSEAKDFSGSGLGLKFSMEMAKRWGMELKYVVPLIETGKDAEKLGWHELRLELKNVGRVRR